MKGDKMKHDEIALRPLNNISGRFYLLLGVLLVIIGRFAYA